MMNCIEFDLAHSFCSEIYKLNKRSEATGNGSGLLHLEQILMDYSPNMPIGAVLENAVNRMKEVEFEEE